MPGLVCAVDVGGTKIAAALADAEGTLSHYCAVPSPAADGPDAVIDAIVGLVLAVMRDAGVRELAGVGIGTAGVVDAGTGVIVSATDTFADWPGTAVADRVRERLGDVLVPDAEITVMNDVDAHALGEFSAGAAAGSSSAVVLAVGTGVGGGVILAGAPLYGAHHVGGEVAHIPTPGAEHLMCPCGRPGHLEAIGSGIGMYRHFLSLGGSADVTDARGVAALARDGDPIASQALAESAQAVGRTLAGIATVIDPERIVITGGVPDIGALWWDPFITEFRTETIDALQHTPVLAGALGNDAPLRGAAVAAWNARMETLNADANIGDAL